MELIAEGVEETREKMAFMLENGCDGFRGIIL